MYHYNMDSVMCWPKAHWHWAFSCSCNWFNLWFNLNLIMLPVMSSESVLNNKLLDRTFTALVIDVCFNTCQKLSFISNSNLWFNKEFNGKKSSFKISYKYQVIQYFSVIDFSSGSVAHGQWKLIRTSDFCQIFSIESI